MQYENFKDIIQKELARHPAGLTWAQLKRRLSLSYERPCAEWIKRMERDIGLTRTRREGRAFLWMIRPAKRRVSAA